jgi:3-isopropylmalate dehydrogenase
MGCKCTSYTIAFIEGDGIGPEQASATREVLAEIDHVYDVSLNFVPVEAGDRTLKARGEALPEKSMEAIKTSDCCLKGPIGESAYDVIIRLRKELDLYANIRPAKSLPNVPSLNPSTDLVIVRENTEDLYTGLESGDNYRATATRVISRRASERIAKYAFETARERKKRVTAIHKVNVMKKTDGLFLSACKEVASKYPDIGFSDMLVDAAAMNLIRNPQDFDVLVTTNMFGDILSDEAAQVAGGLGVAASANIGDGFAIFEPVHGCAPDIAGTNTANPTSLLLSAAMMLNWLGHRRKDEHATRASQAIYSAVDACLASGEVTRDLGGNLTTSEMGRAIKRRFQKEISK